MHYFEFNGHNRFIFKTFFKEIFFKTQFLLGINLPALPITYMRICSFIRVMRILKKSYVNDKLINNYYYFSILMCRYKYVYVLLSAWKRLQRVCAFI